MTTPEEQLNTHLNNIQTRTGKSIEDFKVFVQKSGLQKHAEIRDLLIQKFDLGYGDANTLVHTIKNLAKQKPEQSLETIINEYYSGKKEVLRPIHDKLMVAIKDFGVFEVATKKNYLSLRRKRQFTMFGPVTVTRVEVGINFKGELENERLIKQPPKSMCDYVVKLTNSNEVNADLISWIRMAFDQAG